MNVLLIELATLGLMAGLLLSGSVLLWVWWRWLQRNARLARDRRKVLMVFTGGALPVFAGLFALMLLVDQPRRLLLDYVGLLLALGLGAFVLTLISDLFAGLQLRLRGVARPGIWLGAGEHSGQVLGRGWLQVTLAADDGQQISVPNRYLLRVPLKSGTVAAIPLPQRESPQSAAVKRREPRLDAELDPLPAARQEPTLAEMSADASVAVGSPDPSTAAEPTFVLEDADNEAPPEPLRQESRREPDELRQLKRDYTEMSQQLLALEQSLQDAGQSDQRKSLSLEKKKLQARLTRMEKQIDELAGGERRRA